MFWRCPEEIIQDFVSRKIEVSLREIHFVSFTIISSTVYLFIFT